MIKEHDRLSLEIAKVAEEDMEKAKELVKEKEKVLSEMSNDEIKTLMKRPYPPQYKTKLKKYLK